MRCFIVLSAPPHDTAGAEPMLRQSACDSDASHVVLECQHSLLHRRFRALPEPDSPILWHNHPHHTQSSPHNSSDYRYSTAVDHRPRLRPPRPRPRRPGRDHSPPHPRRRLRRLRWAGQARRSARSTIGAGRFGADRDLGVEQEEGAWLCVVAEGGSCGLGGGK
jgi:hypothetical protein